MVSPATPDEGIHSFYINKDELIGAPLEAVFQSILEELGPEFRGNDGTSLNLQLEAWPGGRWFRDLGNGSGHFWGHVQVIKPPKLLEITGPFFMSHPVANHLQYKLTAETEGTRLLFTHRAFGQIPARMRDEVMGGWAMIQDRIKSRAEKRN